MRIGTPHDKQALIVRHVFRPDDSRQPLEVGRLLAGPLYAGALTRAEAIVQRKRGPSVLQPYRDLRKLLRKGSAISDQASWIFHAAPFVAFACYLTVSVIVPMITNDPPPLASAPGYVSGACPGTAGTGSRRRIQP